MSFESAGETRTVGRGIEDLRRRIGWYATLGMDIVLHGSPNRRMFCWVEPRTPTRPSHNPVTGERELRTTAVYGSRPDDIVSPIWHAAVQPHAEPYEAGRRLDTNDEGETFFTFMANRSLAHRLSSGPPPVGFVYIVNAVDFAPSPYNGLDMISHVPAAILETAPIEVTYHDLGFDLGDLPEVRVTRE